MNLYYYIPHSNFYSKTEIIKDCERVVQAIPANATKHSQDNNVKFKRS